MDNRIVIRHPRKREFFSKLALRGQTAQNVLSKLIDQYLKKEDIMNTQINWTPNQSIQALIEEIQRIEAELADEQLVKAWRDRHMTELPTAKIPTDADTGYPIWSMNDEGYCLVGPNADQIEHIEHIDE